MRKSFSLLLLVSFFLISMTSLQWEVFQSVDGKFKVLAPGEMLKKENPIKTEIGDLNYITFLHQPSEKDPDNLVYMISYCDYPEYTIHSDSSELLKEFFQTTIETAVESVNGDLKYSSEIKIDDFPGVLWRVDYNSEKAVIKTKAFLVNNRYYSIQVISLKEKGMNISVDKFLDSFSLIGNESIKNP